MQPNQHTPDIRNLIIAVVLSTTVLLGWQMLVEEPKREAAAEKARLLAEQQKDEVVLPSVEKPSDALAMQTEAEVAPENEPRVELDTNVLHGSVNLKGLRIDEITLKDYKETLEDDSPDVSFLKPSYDKDGYFVEFGWLAGDSSVQVPGKNTVWQSKQSGLKTGKPLVATWQNGNGLQFEQQMKAKDDYLFEVTQQVTNNGSKAVTLYPYGLINRSYADTSEHFYILHEGPLGVFGDELTEVDYEELRDEKKIAYDNKKGWFGITDKYWLTAIVPSQEAAFNTSMNYFTSKGRDKYQVDYRGEAITIQPGEHVSINSHVFIGAKKVSLLDRYGQQLNVPLFDRAVDFGMLYFLTKPIFHALQYFNGLLGNFGLAIMLLTVCIKLLLFPLANKSYSSMSQLKLLMPKITEIRERYSDDKMKMNQEIMELYKQERVNPASGCLPMLLQLPVFFALYKVLFVTIEMRHAPFYGWVEDLSAQDPTTIFNLFGLIDWTPPSMLMIGAWPLIMCATMVIQQRLNPKPADPSQAMVMQWLPYIFLFVFASFPAGLVIYWAWNNSLSIIQQWIITQRHKAKYETPASAS